MVTYYEKKRRKTTLTRSDVANYLGIDYDRYELIERGKVKMPKNLINKFNELMNKQKGEVEIDQLNREQIVNEWWDKVRVKKGKGKYGLTEYLDKFNIRNLSQLAELMGYNNKLAIQQKLNNYGNYTIDYNFKNRLYSFFENELNIQPIENKKLKYSTKRTYTEDEEWLSHFDIKSYLKDNGISHVVFANMVGISDKTISSMLFRINTSSVRESTVKPIINWYKATPAAHEYFYPNTVINTLGKFKEDKTIKKASETVVKELKEKVSNNTRDKTLSNVDTLIEKYNNKIDKNLKQCEALNNCINEYTEKIKELRAKLNIIEKENSVYKEFVSDLTV